MGIRYKDNIDESTLMSHDSGICVQRVAQDMKLDDCQIVVQRSLRGSVKHAGKTCMKR
jgi:hypothetical protein